MLIEPGQRVVVAMSGGVDSSVCAGLLKERGCDVVGMTMQIWDYRNFESPAGNSFGTCCSLDDVYDARKVADALDIPFYVVNFERHFEHAVIEKFCDDYFSGRTPNPCILCNQSLKFDILLRRARELQANYLVTGHYAQLVQHHNRYSLFKGLDTTKDQSYFLFTMTQEQMQYIRFPLGHLTKKMVREHAARLNMPVAEKDESQDICFVPDGNYVRFLEERCGHGTMDGDIIHVKGQVLGKHRGTYRFTIGQRRGLGLAWPEPLYVIAVDAEKKHVIVGERQYLYVKSCYLSKVNWIIDCPKISFEAKCRIRYRHTEVEATIKPVKGDAAKIEFRNPQTAVTPGQALVIYDGEQVLGGGWIESSVSETVG
ncbi:MAG: tRNA 2-thiouridine(34) synthase MnmA [Deltaproteobacteria bacterium]|nr:tRNA 2-thiouridine(34) synthase MnmA [Deltaproteobacteria bacterium]